MEVKSIFPPQAQLPKNINARDQDSGFGTRYRASTNMRTRSTALLEEGELDVAANGHRAPPRRLMISFIGLRTDRSRTADDFPVRAQMSEPVVSATEAAEAPVSSSTRSSPAPVYVSSRTHSCALCQRRKVKCDRRKPCAACVKSGVECVSTELATPQRRKRKLTNGDGLEPAPVGSAMNSTINSSSAASKLSSIKSIGHKRSYPDHYGSANRPSLGGVTNSSGSDRGTLISGPGSTKLLDNNLWNGLQTELRTPQGAAIQHWELRELENRPVSLSAELVNADGGAFLFGMAASTVSLTPVHPQPIHIFKLWQAFLDNINPLSKVIHGPTLQHQILEATGNLGGISKGMEALMFAIYSSAVNSMSNSECETMVGEPRSLLLKRFLKATQQALTNAGFLKTTDLQVLQAFTIFLLSVRQHYDPHTLWILTGVAVRIGQRIGIHRDGVSLGLSIFDSEIRRRLCWQIVLLDSRSAQLSGQGTSLMAHLYDNKLPLNVNDSDLSPEMQEAPMEHTGITEMVFCLIRYEFGSFLRGTNTSSGFDGSWQKLSSDEVSLAAKDKMLDDLKGYLENKYLRYCDFLVPLHALSAAVARTAVCKVRLVAHHPSQYPDNGASLSEAEKDMLFETSLKIVEYDSIGQSTKSMKRFLWHINSYFQLDAFVYLISELRHRTSADEVSNAWHQVQVVYDKHRELITNTSNELYAAIGDLTVKAWAARERHHHGPQVPEFITELRAQRSETIEKTAIGGTVVNRAGWNPNGWESGHVNGYQPISATANNTHGDSDELGPDLNFDPSLELSPMDWAWWDGLLQGKELQIFEGTDA